MAKQQAKQQGSRCRAVAMVRPRFATLLPVRTEENCAHDRSAEGAAERAQSYLRITAELCRLFAGWPADVPQSPSVLVPGAGLAWLCLEILKW